MKVIEKITGFLGGLTTVLGKYNSRKLLLAAPVIFKLIAEGQYLAAAVALSAYVISQGFADGLEKLVAMFPELREVIKTLIEEFKARRAQTLAEKVNEKGIVDA